MLARYDPAVMTVGLMTGNDEPNPHCGSERSPYTARTPNWELRFRAGTHYWDAVCSRWRAIVPNGVPLSERVTSPVLTPCRRAGDSDRYKRFRRTTQTLDSQRLRPAPRPQPQED